MKTQRIPIEKDLVMRLFCFCCQAYRSVHRALQEGFWPAFVAYYSDKKQALQCLIDRLHESIPAAYRDSPSPTLQELSRITPRLGIFRYLFGAWLSGRKQSWRLTVQEVLFLSSALRRLVGMLEFNQAPTFEDLYVLQVDLCHCSGVFEMHCYGLRELDRARRVEHFDQTEWVEHYHLWEIPGEPCPTIPGSDSPIRVAG